MLQVMTQMLRFRYDHHTPIPSSAKRPDFATLVQKQAELG